jgi:hypothetical protein
VGRRCRSPRMGAAKRYPSMPVSVGWVSLRSTHPTIDISSQSRGTMCPRFASSFALFENRGRREDRVLAAPAVSRAICANKTAHEHTGQREHSSLPCAMALRAYFVLFPENGSFASVASGTLPANLAPAPRRPNHTTSPYASGAYVYRALSVHRISPHVRDDRERPSSAVRRRSYADDLRENESGIFLIPGLDTISENQK